VPLVNLADGVYILPGIPKLFQMLISAHQACFCCCSYHSGYNLIAPLSIGMELGVKMASTSVGVVLKLPTSTSQRSSCVSTGN
jgi:hypothetical protein